MNDPGSLDSLGEAVSVEEFARRALLVHFQAMISHIDGIIENTDLEPIHQFRVAARRLRAVAGTFSGIFLPDETRNLLATIKELAALAGKARDLDVHIALYRDYLKEYAPAEARSIRAYLNELHSERQALQPLIVAVLNALRTSGFIHDFTNFFSKLKISTTISEISRLRSLMAAP